MSYVGPENSSSKHCVLQGSGVYILYTWHSVAKGAHPGDEQQVTADGESSLPYMNFT